MKVSRYFGQLPVLVILIFTWQACLQVGVTLPETPPDPTSTSILIDAEPSPFSQPSPSSQDMSAQPPACTQIGQQWVSPIDGMILMCVPAGEFLMGASEADTQAQSDEKPQHRVYLDAFWIDRTEVTNANFAKCVAEGVCHPRLYSPYLGGVSSLTRRAYYDNPTYDDYPVIHFDVTEAQTYCQWARRRLPTEAEWEKAARGPDERLFPWGDELDCQYASYLRCTEDTTKVDVPLRGTSPYGVLNLAGNVWEWVQDWYDPEYYSSSPANNPLGPKEGEFRTRRGGGWHSLARDLRVTNRGSGEPRHYFDGQMGFRCAMSAGAPSPTSTSEPVLKPTLTPTSTLQSR